MAGGLLVALAVPTLGMDTRLPGIDTLPRDLEVVQTYDRIQAAFPGQTNTLVYDDLGNRGWYWLTLQSPRATKDRALRELAELNGVAIEQVTVFGDEINDIPMFHVAGRGVAVENAIPELRRIAQTDSYWLIDRTTGLPELKPEDNTLFFSLSDAQRFLIALPDRPRAASALPKRAGSRS